MIPDHVLGRYFFILAQLEGVRVLPNAHNPKLLMLEITFLAFETVPRGVSHMRGSPGCFLFYVVQDGRSLIPDRDAPVVLTGTRAVRHGIFAKRGPFEKA